MYNSSVLFATYYFLIVFIIKKNSTTFNYKLAS